MIQNSLIDHIINSSEPQDATIMTFYYFAPLADPKAAQEQLIATCQQHGIKGTILLAHEGINSTIAGSREGLRQVLTAVSSLFPQAPTPEELRAKFSQAHIMPFYRLKVKIKPEIVTMGQPNIDINQRGQHLSPKAWNQLLQDPNTVLVDTRNDYEVQIGTFKQAVNPNLDHFRQWPDYVDQELAQHKDKNIAIFCTGGIRCEKASAYMLQQGFKNVYQLDGGILNYLAQMPKEQSQWKGECFVFDQRTTVTHELSQGEFHLCYGCRHPITAEDERSELFELGVSCPQCYNKTTERQKANARERQKQIELTRRRNNSTWTSKNIQKD